jgi:ASC-1-like (ASCH) protein
MGKLFSEHSLMKALSKSGFSRIYSNTGEYEIGALAIKMSMLFSEHFLGNAFP